MWAREAGWRSLIFARSRRLPRSKSATRPVARTQFAAIVADADHGRGMGPSVFVDLPIARRYRDLMAQHAAVTPIRPASLNAISQAAFAVLRAGVRVSLSTITPCARLRTAEYCSVGRVV